MKCRHTQGQVYFYCPWCQKSGTKIKDLLKHVKLDFEAIIKLKGGYRTCEYCGAKTTLDDLTCIYCGHKTVML